jgi:hypothetical protein
MTVMKSKRLAFLCCALTFLVVPVATAAPVCDMKVAVPQSARTYAKTGDQAAWREFRSIQDVPPLDTDGGASTQLWRSETGASFAYTAEPGEDFWTYTRYCFDETGQLARVSFEVRTAWGWSYRLEGPVVKGVLHTNSAGFFSTENERPISKPEGASDVSEALKPTLYLTTSKLPFAHLLAHPSQLSPR